MKNKETLEKMAAARTGAANMLTGAAAAIVVLGDETVTDVWTEDCSIVMASMHLMASSLGIGSCWIQGRNREAADGSSSEEYLRELLPFSPASPSGSHPLSRHARSHSGAPQPGRTENRKSARGGPWTPICW